MTLSPCGVNCESCHYYKDCGGCRAIKGKPFYLKDFGFDTCPMYDCPIAKKGYQSCAECSELPCQTYYDWKDPSMTDEAHLNSIKDRVTNLKKSLG